MAFRPDEEVLQFFEGFDLVEPGLVDVREWHPEQEAPEVKIELVGAIARKAGWELPAWQNHEARGG